MTVREMEVGLDGTDLPISHNQPSTHTYKPSKFLSPCVYPDTWDSPINDHRETMSSPFACWHSKQPDLTENMRRKVVEWMRELTADLCLKRETYHCSVWILDRVLSSSFPVPKSTLQLVGLAAVMISAKLEEVSPPALSDYEQAVEYGYSRTAIRRMERMVLRELQWKVTPVTLNSVLNRLLAGWDEYILSMQFPGFPLFKQSTKAAYSCFRYSFHLLDRVLLRSSHYSYPQSHLCTAIFYLSLAHGLSISPDSLETSIPLKETQVMNTMKEFISALGVTWKEVETAVEFISLESDAQEEPDMPRACAILKKEELERHFEEFLAYQTVY